MANLGKVIAVLGFYALAFLALGSLLLYRRKKDKTFSFSKAILTGFFGYHALFQVIAIPVMFLQKPLSVLTRVWMVLIGFLLLYGIWRYGRCWWDVGKQRVKGLFGADWLSWIPILVMGATVLLASVLYVSFWDATYYVGQVSFSVYTDTINQIDPLSGDVLKVFDLKHCLATYHVNDAVICQIFGIPALVETKTVMVAVIAALTNVLYYRIACRLFQDRKEAVAIFMLLTLVINVCTYSSYTASGFFFYRTYEGKAITANLSIPAVIYLLLGLYGEGESKDIWKKLFLVCWGSVAIASSAMFLVPATVAAGVIPYAIWKKCPVFVGKLILVVLPSAAVIACYLLGRMGWLEIAIRYAG